MSTTSQSLASAAAPTHPEATSPPFWLYLFLFHLLPLHAPLTLLLLDAPFGRFALSKSRLNLPGNLAWATMEIVSPIAFILTLAPNIPLLTDNAKVLAALFLGHYFHRAIVSPLILAPKRAPLHIVVVLAGMAFVTLNATCLARALAAYPPPGDDLGERNRISLGILLGMVGFAGNFYHDEILHDLRRAPWDTLVSEPDTSDKSTSPGGRYRIPRAGLFRLVSFPNYLCEWLEWTGFALAASPTLFIAAPPFSLAGLPHWLAFVEPAWPTRFLAPAWCFVFAEVASMLPRAIRGHAWYKATFPNYPKQRTAVVPFVL